MKKKIRIWKEKEKRMYCFDNPERINLGYVLSLITTENFLEPMLWTSFRDKNGKDIYERDFIRMYTATNDKIYGEVIFKDGSYGIQSGDEFYPFILLKDMPIELEIVGNYYEGYFDSANIAMIEQEAVI